MPPANSPAEGDRHQDIDQPPNSALGSALSSLTTPVPDYASTLTVADDEVNDANLSFLRHRAVIGGAVGAETQRRDSLALQGWRRRQQLRDGGQTEHSSVREERERQFLAHRAALVQQRHDSQAAWAGRMSGRTNGGAYGDRIPQQQSLYDWAPAQGQSDMEISEEELRVMAARIREQQQHTPQNMIRTAARIEAETRQRLDSPSSGRSPASAEPSLRALMSRYIQDRERERDRDRDGDRVTPSEPQVTDSNQQPSTRSRLQAAVDAVDELASALPSIPRITDMPDFREPRLVRAATPLERVDRDASASGSSQRRFLDNPSTKVTEFERIIKYLHRVRLDDEHGVSGMEYASPPRERPRLVSPQGLNMDQDMVRRMRHVQPHPSAWLVPGMTFTGQQQAAPTNSSSSTLHRLASDRPSATSTARPSSLAPSEPWFGRGLTATPQPMAASPAGPSAQTSPLPDTWTVKVAVHSIDYKTMTQQGTMEAFNVPSFTAHALPLPTSPSGGSRTTFSTYLEGELIDFSRHTLLTESDRQFAQKTTPDIDAAYWRKLEPFAKLSDEEIARALLDRKWIEEQLMGKYVLMRWKERCFVRPTYTSFSHRNANPTAATQQGAATSSGTTTTTTTTSPTAFVPPPTPASRTTSFLAGADGNGYGLSISGFYYVSMRRSDGRCEGLYFDPQSSPYQRLELAPTARGLWGAGAWEVR